MEAIKTYEDEVITKVLVEKFNLTGVKLFIFCELFFFGGMILLSQIFGLNVGKGKIRIGFLQDVSTMADFTILNPLVIVVFVSFFKKYTVILEELYQSGRINLDNERIQHFIKLSNRFFTKKIIHVTIFVITAIIIVLHSMNTIQYKDYFAVGESLLTVPGFYMMIVTGVYVYVLLHYFLKTFFLIKLLKMIFSEKITIQLLHEDSCGGLKPIGDLLLRITYVLFLLAATASFFLYNDIVLFNNPFSVRVILLLPVYLIATPFIFFYPLIPIHSRMEEERSKYLRDIGNRFERVFQKFHESIKKDTCIETAAQEMEEMKTLQEMFSWVKNIPKWPIDTSAYIKFGATWIVPFSAFIFQIIVNRENIRVVFQFFGL